MYVALLVVLFALAALPLWAGLRRRRRALIALAAAWGVLVTLGFASLGLFAELYWFQALGQEARFWTLLGWQVGMVAGGALVGAVVVFLLNWEVRPVVRRTGTAVGALAGAAWGGGAWEPFLLFVHGEHLGDADPIFGLDTGFYLFTLPFLEALQALAVMATVITALAAVASFGRLRGSRLKIDPAQGQSAPVLMASAVLGVAVGFGLWLGSYHLMYSTWGVVAGPGWTDVTIRLPAYRILAGAAVVAGLLPAVPPLRRILGRPTPLPEVLTAPAASWGAFAVLSLLGLQVLPGLVQWLWVEPNEITYEEPYIAHNIAYTRRGFGLDAIEDRQFPAAEAFTPEMAERNAHLLSEVRLWDWRALVSVYEQFQEIRLYYEFTDVDIDRYHLGDRYRQVMISPRELEQDNLPAQSRTFVNEFFKYTHGFGLTMATVSDFTAEGLPNLLVRDLPPKSSVESLEVTQPRIYYGEIGSPVVVNSEEPEFDYPSGEENVSVRYDGEGGVRLSSVWRKFVFGWGYGGTRLLVSSYPTPDSRIQLHRRILDRASTLAPFLRYDSDPYVVLADGKMYWMIDAYTTSRWYPYSEPFPNKEIIEYRDGEVTRRMVRATNPRLAGANYVRNSVKVVIDAYDGTVTFYVFDDEDPLIRAWRSALPGLFADASAMPEALQAHVRYPEDLLLAQGIVYAKYHMNEATVFYNQEDLWVRATEKYYADVQPVEPYYVMWQPPDADRPEFVLMLPFTPKNRQVLIGWIAGRCDRPNYGRFLSYKFPKEKRILGPQQVETKIDQDPVLSGKLTLWDQRGSRVIRGNVLAIPIEDTLLYVEPIYLQAETAAYPELRLVVAMHGDTLGYGESLDEALAALFGETHPEVSTPAADVGEEDLGPRANEAFQKWLQLQAEGDYAGAAEQLETLSALLERLGGAPDSE